MSNTSTTYDDEGMDLKLNLDRPMTSSQMDDIVDPLLSTFDEKLKLVEDNIVSSSDEDMDIPEAKPNRGYMLSPVYAMHKTLSFRQNLDKLDGLSNFVSNTPSVAKEALCSTGEREKHGFEESGGLRQVNATGNYFVNREAQSQTLPFIVPDLGDFNAGTCNSFPMPHERRRKWMARNRRSAGISNARRLGLMENFQAKKQRLDELD